MSVDPAAHCDPARMARWRQIDAERRGPPVAARVLDPLIPSDEVLEARADDAFRASPLRGEKPEPRRVARFLGGNRGPALD